MHAMRSVHAGLLSRPFARSAPRIAFPCLLIAALACATPEARAQFVVYETYRPVVAAPVIAAPVMAAPTYVANYFPSGNYAAVTAFSPPVVAAPAAVAVRTAYAPVYAPAPVATTSYYAPAATTSYYAPAATTAYYAPAATTAYYAPPVAEAVVAAPVTAYYAPAAVAVPMRRGLFGGYRPVRSAYYIPY